MIDLLGAGVSAIVAISGFAVFALGLYLAVLTLAAIRNPRVPPATAPRRRFAVLVPAHDEETVIGRLLSSLDGQNYPRQRFDVFVVADNCTDATARVARRAGAIVHERRDTSRRAKGHALRWLLERVRAYDHYDAYVFFDADSVVSPGFLSSMDARLEAGSKVIQAHYRVLNAAASPVSAMREAAFASLHYVRPLGRSALGLSCGLKGNGMCFAAASLDEHGWSSTGLAEDVELHLGLVRAGIRVDFAPEAVVRADMPVSLRAATSQNLRWEAGRLNAARVDVAGMLRDGLRRRNALEIDAAIEQIIPPLSVALVAGIACGIGSARAGTTVALVASSMGTGLIVAHVLAGLVAVRAPTRSYLVLLAAPAYIVWKLTIWTRALFERDSLGWIRTPRALAKPRDP
jgi:cellulose synthase/poly-beta-1,6-N-acetylglucosamine synthase-like glycosyltransferase